MLSFPWQTTSVSLLTGCPGMCLPTESLDFMSPGGRHWLCLDFMSPGGRQQVSCTFCMHAQLCQLLVSPWTVARQASLAMEFSRQEYWSGLPCPSPGIHWYGGGGIHYYASLSPTLPWWDSLKLWFCVFKVPTFDSNMVTFYRTLLNITLLSSFVLGLYLPTSIQVFPGYMLSF